MIASDGNETQEMDGKWHSSASSLGPEIAVDFLPPVMQLPAELMDDIFSIVVEESDGRWSEDKPPQLVRITHVCKRWRDVAIGTPFLWRRPPMLSVSGMTQYLARSYPVAVDITITFDLQHITEMHAIIEEVTRHSSRIQCLCIENIPEGSDFILRPIPVPKWRLEDLSLGGRPAIDDEKVQIPNAMIGHTRDLRRLSLSFCRFDRWDLFDHWNLTELRLCSIQPPPPLRTLKQVISRIEALEKLSLLSAFDAAEGSTSPRMSLDHLKELIVCDSAREIAVLFQSIAFRSTCRVDIIVDSFEHSVEEGIFLLLRSYFRARSIQPIINTDITYRSLYFMESYHVSDKIQTRICLSADTLESWDPEGSNSMYRFWCKSHFSLSIKESSRVMPRVALAAVLFLGLPLRQISHIFLQSDARDACLTITQPLVSVLSWLPEITFIATVGGMNEFLTRALGLEVEDQKGALALCFPKLSSVALCFHGFLFPITQANASNIDFDILEDGLAQRKNCNRVIKKVILEKSEPVTEGNVARIQLVTDEVVIL